MNRLLSLCLAMALLLSGISTVLADQIHLTNGHIIYGKITDKTKERIRITFDSGDVEFLMREVDFIVVESDLEYYMSQGDLYLSRHNFRKSIEKYTEALKEIGGRERVESKLINVYSSQGEFLASNKMYPEALVSFRNVLTFDAQNAAATLQIQSLAEKIEAMDLRSTQVLSLLQAGKLREGILNTEDLLKEAPWLHSTLVTPLAMAYIRYGNEKFRVKLLAGASDAYRKGMELDPAVAHNISLRLLNTENKLAFDAIQNNNYKNAYNRMEYITSMFPTSGYSQYLLGISLEKLDKEAAARDIYLTLLQGKLNKNVRKIPTFKLRRNVEDALGLRSNEPQVQSESVERWHEKQFAQAQTLETEHFTIHHHNKFVAKQVSKTAEYHLRRIAKKMQLNLKGNSWKKCNLYIYATQQDYISKGLQKDWSGGSTRVSFTDGTLTDNTIATWQTSPSLLNAVLPHEISHLVFLIRLGPLRTQYPRWILEGLATTEEPQYKKNHLLQTLTHAAKHGSLMSLDDVIRNKVNSKDEEQIRLFYAQSYTLVSMLLESDDFHTFLSFAQKAKTVPIFQLLNELYDYRTEVELQAKWRSYIRKFSR